MRTLIKGLALALSTSFIVACGGGGGPMEAGLKHEMAMLKIIEANKTDVAKATTELEAYLKTNEADIKAQKEALAAVKADPDTSKISAMGKASLETRMEVSKLQVSLREGAKDVLNDAKVSELLDNVR